MANVETSACVRAACAVLCAVGLVAGCGDDDATPVDSGLAPDDAAMDGASLPPVDAGLRDAAPPPACPTDPWPAAIDAFEVAVKVELDSRRAVGGVCDTTIMRSAAALSDDSALGRAARCHAYDMMTRDSVSARGSDGATFEERAARAGYAGTATGQAFGFVAPDTTARAWVDGLLTGGATCRTLLDPDATDVGVGIAPMDVGSGTSARRYFQITVGH